MSQELYYIAPPDEVFKDMKEAATEIWKSYDDTYGYATEKIDRIKDLKNISDNFMTIFAMFDYLNQAKVTALISPETKLELDKRLPKPFDGVVKTVLRMAKQLGGDSTDSTFEVLPGDKRWKADGFKEKK